MREFVAHYHEERPHQSRGNVPLPVAEAADAGEPPVLSFPAGEVRRRERLGGRAEHDTYALRPFPEVGRIDPEEGGNDRGPGSEPSDEGSGNQAVLTEKGVVRQFGSKAPRAEHTSNSALARRARVSREKAYD